MLVKIHCDQAGLVIAIARRPSPLPHALRCTTARCTHSSLDAIAAAQKQAKNGSRALRLGLRRKLLLRVAPDAPPRWAGAVALRCLRGAAAVHGHVLRHNQTVLAHATSPALVLRYERAGDEVFEDAPAWLCDHVVVEVTAAANQQLAVTEAPDVAWRRAFRGRGRGARDTCIIWRPLAEPQPGARLPCASQASIR